MIRLFHILAHKFNIVCCISHHFSIVMSAAGKRIFKRLHVRNTAICKYDIGKEMPPVTKLFTDVKSNISKILDMAYKD